MAGGYVDHDVIDSTLQNAPLTLLVIESVNRKPDDNPAGVATALSVTPARFETASIKLANPDKQGMSDWSTTGDNQMRANGTPCALIAMAFQMPPSAICRLVSRREEDPTRNCGSCR